MIARIPVERLATTTDVPRLGAGRPALIGAQRSASGAPGVIRLLDRLQEAGYVARASCDRDAGITHAVITGEGRAKLAEAFRSHVAAIRALLERRYSE